MTDFTVEGLDQGFTVGGVDAKEQAEYERLVNLRNARRTYVDLQRASNGQTGSRWGSRKGAKVHAKSRTRHLRPR